MPLSGLDPTGLAALRRRAVGYVFQELNLLPALTAAEKVALPLELDGVRPRDARALALRALDEVGLADVSAGSPTRCRAGSSSASRSPARWSATDGSCSPTSRPARWTR